MDVSEIPNKRKVFVGVDFGHEKLIIGLVNTYGNLLSSGVTFFPKDTIKLGEHIIDTIKGMRGGANVRMKNFAGIGISIASPDIKIGNIEQQINKIIDIPIYIGEHNYVKQLGEKWLKKLGNNSGVNKNFGSWDLTIVYGAIKLIKEKSSIKLGSK